METTYTDNRPNKTFVLFLGWVLTAGIWSLDFFVLGPEITLTLLYLLPIALVSWYIDGTQGALLATASTFAWFSVFATQDPFFARSFLTYMNLFLKLIIYLGCVVLMTALKRSLQREQSLSRTDYLTGAANGRAFTETLASELNRARRNNKPVTLIYLDIDNFKTVNDTFGHTAGDRLLCLTAATIGEHVRVTDTVARMGGDEFAVLLPELDYDAADIVVKKIHRYLNEMTGKNELPTTFSLGVATCKEPPDTTDEMIKQADTLMYTAKQNGKNRIYHETCGTRARGILVDQKK